VDLFRIDPLHCPVFHRSVDPARADRRHRQFSEWIVDGSDRTQSHRCRRWFFAWKRYLIHDRDPLYTREFLATLATVGIKSVKLPPQSANLNAYAERFVRTIREDCLKQMIFFGEDALRNAIREFVTHYHLERNHQGLDNRLIVPMKTIPTNGTIRKHQRLGGVLNYYYREAA